jgi:signal transduction histidine kinase
LQVKSRSGVTSGSQQNPVISIRNFAYFLLLVTKTNSHQMKRIPVLLFCLWINTCFSQHSILDSLTNLYRQSATDSAKCYNLILLASEFSNTNVDSSLSMMKEAIEIAQKLKSDILIVKAYDIAGFCYGKKGDYEKANTYLFDALRLAEKINCIDCIAYVKNELAVIEKSKNNFSKTLSILQEVMQLPQEELKDRTKFKVYQNIGLSYNSLGKPDSAMLFFQKALPMADKINNPYAKALLINNIAVAYHLNNNFPKAIENYQQVANIGRTIPDNELLFLSTYNIGDISLRQNDLPAAIARFEESIIYAQKLKREDYLIYAYGSLIETNEKKGDSKEALRYFHLYDVARDTLNLKQNNKNVAELETKYQTEKKEAQIKVQGLELKQKSAEIFRQRSFLFALIAGLIAVTVLGYLFYYRYRLKQKQILNEALIREQQLGLSAVIEAQETERKRIAKDLHDGIAQELVAMKMGFEQFRDKENSEKFNGLLSSLDDACKEVRDLSHVMSPPMLENRGLPGSLEMLLRNSLGIAGIQHKFENLGVNERIDEKIELGIYRIAQELINNIIKHAKANNVVVQLQKMGTQLILRVEDNGESFDFESAKYKGSMGLLNILSRVRTLNGSFVSEPSTPSGTVSLLRVPVKS